MRRPRGPRHLAASPPRRREQKEADINTLSNNDAEQEGSVLHNGALKIEKHI